MVSLMAWNDILTGLNLVMARDFLEVLFLIRVRANDYEIVVIAQTPHGSWRTLTDDHSTIPHRLSMPQSQRRGATEEQHSRQIRPKHAYTHIHTQG